MKKSFKEQLKIVQENNCFVWDIVVADACQAILHFEYTDEEFERLCEAALSTYLKSDNISADEIVYAINGLIFGGKTIDEVCEMSKWDLLDYAVNGVPDNSPWCEGWKTSDDCEDCEMVECNCNPKYVEGR